MRWRGGLDVKMVSLKIMYALLAFNLLQTCHGARQVADRRKDTSALYLPEPSAESLAAIAQAMGAAGFEDKTEGKTLVKRLIPADSQPDLDVVEHMGIIGRVGVDFPALPNIPPTGFNCKNVPTGYYADLETDCQVFHICDTSRKISFLCPNGTIFSQSHLICDWWFKVDCASAPALYEASVEYYSNEQKKSQKVGRTLSKTADNVRPKSQKVPVTSTTERLLRHRQKLENNGPVPTDIPPSRSYQTLFQTNPTQVTTEFDKRKKNLVQLISNDFNNHPSKTTLPVYDLTTRKTTQPVYDHNSLKEMQVAAETASFAQNQNRQFLQEYNSKNLRPYPVYNHNLQGKLTKTKTLTTLYDITATNVPHYTQEATTKRQTLVPYTKTYTINDNREPYTRPGVSLLREFLEKEKNKTLTTTEKIAVVRSDKFQNKMIPEKKVTIEDRSSSDSVTKVPYIGKNHKQSVTVNTNVDRVNSTESTPEISYKDRRERLLRKLDLKNFTSGKNDNAQTTVPTNVPEKYYGDQSNRPGLVVPPSLTPKTLHSLAIYYATALDNFATTPIPDNIETTTNTIDEYEPIAEELPALFSKQTIAKYGNLFGQGSNDEDMLEDIKLDPNSTYNELAEDLSAQMSQGPLSTSPQIRELAQVFTHALSAYLQDPIKFRKVLSDIRPTQPSFADILDDEDAAFNTEATTTVNEEDDEILGFSDDHKIKSIENSLRSGKAINIATDYPTTIDEITTTIKPTTEIPPYSPTTPRSPLRCCGRISASYTTAPTPRNPYFTSLPSTNYAAGKINSLGSYYTENPNIDYSNTKIKNGYFQNSNTKLLSVTDSPYSNDYTETTTLTTESDVFDSTYSPITNSHQLFESKKIITTTSTPESTPIDFAETDSIELENEEELQRAHSQSFVTPQANNIRKGKQINEFQDNLIIKKPVQNLEAPTQSTIDITTTIQTTTQASTSVQDQTPSLTTANPSQISIFTSPENDKYSNEFQWHTTFGNWQSTIIDPITLNDGLSSTGPEQIVSEIAQQTNEWTLESATTPATFTTTNEPPATTTVNVELTTNVKQEERFGRLLTDTSSTEASQDLSVVTDTIVEKAKQIMEGMNSTTTQKLMNVMKKTKSKTVKRLILLLVQTCDDDHNSTAEASKKALLEALMAVSQKDMDEIAREEDLTETTTPSTFYTPDVIKITEFQRRMDRIQVQPRQNKNINIEAEAVNSLSTPTTTLSFKTEETHSTPVTTARTPRMNRRGSRKYSFSTASELTHTTAGDRPIAEARTAPQREIKIQSDTRALELLRSLYTIAARWGK